MSDRQIYLRAMVAISVLAASVTALSASAITERDLATFRNFLSASGFADRWERPPQRLDSPEISRAYRDQRFYFTFEQPPQPPGAPMPELIAAYDEAWRKYKRNSLRITVAIGSDGNVRILSSPQDFNAGLMSIKSDEEATVAAAAIASLLNEHDAMPARVLPNDIRVVKTGDGWTCRIETNVHATVSFDRDGKCITATKSLARPQLTPP